MLQRVAPGRGSSHGQCEAQVHVVHWFAGAAVWGRVALTAPRSLVRAPCSADGKPRRGCRALRRQSPRPVHACEGACGG